MLQMRNVFRESRSLRGWDIKCQETEVTRAAKMESFRITVSGLKFDVEFRWIESHERCVFRKALITLSEKSRDAVIGIARHESLSWKISRVTRPRDVILFGKKTPLSLSPASIFRPRLLAEDNFDETELE